MTIGDYGKDYEHEVRIPLKPWHVMAACTAYLAAAWAAFVFIDALNFAGLRDSLVATGLQMPATWPHIFREGGPTEILQWLCLGIASVLAATVAGELRSTKQRDADTRMFWMLMSIALMFLLIEDAGNPRHYIRDAVFELTGSQTARLAVESLVFMILAGLPLYALVRYRREVIRFGSAKWYLLCAFLCYGVAGVASATRYAWYEDAGAIFHAVVGSDLLELEHPHFTEVGIEFFLMDWLFEESVELLGAAFFVCATLAFVREFRTTEPARAQL